MSLWTMIFLLAVAGMIYTAWIRHQEIKQGIVRDSMGDPVRDKGLGKAREAELLRELDDLRERVQVLERIATDDRESLSLAREIDQLRDDRSASQ